jgi:hypothetical protein
VAPCAPETSEKIVSGSKICPSIGNRSTFESAFSKGVPVCDHAPGGNADMEIRALWLAMQRMLSG